MGILINGCSIFLGGLLGNAFKGRIRQHNTAILGISIMLLSCVGGFENVFASLDPD